VGYIDLHCHYLPGVDDGVRTLEESLRVLTGLRGLGFERVIATPHIRTGMFENRRPGLEAAFGELEGLLDGMDDLPERGLGAEHYCDDVFWRLFQDGEALPYPGGKAALVEFHYEVWPQRIERVFFKMKLAGVLPVLAHPERYAALHRRTDPLDPLLDAGAAALLDLMSLVGRYGRRPQEAAERMLEEGAYDAACTDCHRPEDIYRVASALMRLEELVGVEEKEHLLSAGPAALLRGTLAA
jgi:protein-tyrosine phosphatase